MGKEDCTSLTALISQLRDEVGALQFLMRDKQFEKVDARMKRIDILINEKADFLRWRKFEKKYYGKIEKGSVMRSERTKNIVHPGFWPIRISDNGGYLAYLSESIWLTRIDLETGRKVTNGLSRRKKWIDCSYFRIDDDGSLILRGDEQNSTFPPNIYYAEKPDFGNDFNVDLISVCGTPDNPKIFDSIDAVASVGSYELGVLSMVNTGFRKGKNFDVKFRSHDPSEFVSISLSEEGKSAFTLDLEGHLDLWDCEKAEYVVGIEAFSGKCLDYKLLPGNRILVLMENKLAIWRFSNDGSLEGSPFVGRENDGYVHVAVDQEKTRCLAISESGVVDVYRSDDLRTTVASFDLSSEVRGREIKTFNLGTDDSLVIGFADGEVMIFGNSIKRNKKGKIIE